MCDTCERHRQHADDLTRRDVVVLTVALLLVCVFVAVLFVRFG